MKTTMEKPDKEGHLRKCPDIVKTIAMLVCATLLGYLFWKLGFSEANIIMMYILGVLVTSVITEHQIYSLIASIVSVIVFNFLFTEPRYTFLAYDKDYPFTFITMLVAAMMTGSLADRLKRQAEKAAQATLMAQKEQLRANLLRSISHDLRTPLTSISGNASNLISNGKDFDEETKMQLYLDIYDDSMWLINLVENLLSVTKIEDDTFNIRMKPELVEEIISEALEHVNRKKSEHKIVLEPSEEFILVKVDAGLIMQVIINLVDNAIKYTQQNSGIRIKVWREKAYAFVQVADDGPGIPDSEKKLVFDMFYSGEKAPSDNRRSMGLGLALCKSIVLAHGGDIWVSDQSPHGAGFTFSLPVTDLEEVDMHE